MIFSKKKIIRFIKLITYCILLGVIVIFSIDIWVKIRTKEQIYTSTNEIPHNKVGMVLGTGKYMMSGQVNLYYAYRIDATVALFKAGKIDFVLVSGDNGDKYYDEPTTIKKDLVAKGIPAERIYLDYAGFRTLDSVVRSKEIFGQSKITIISQKFHNERAIFLARNNDIEAVGFNAEGVTVKYGFKTMVREKLARVKLMLDLLFGKNPKFLGDPVEIR